MLMGSGVLAAYSCWGETARTFIFLGLKCSCFGEQGKKYPEVRRRWLQQPDFGLREGKLHCVWGEGQGRCIPGTGEDAAGVYTSSSSAPSGWQVVKTGWQQTFPFSW